MHRFLLIAVLLASCGTESSMATSDFPPNGYEVTGTDVVWADDFSITEGIGTISSVADAGGGDIRAQTGAAHGLVVGQYVRFQGFTNYDGEYAITAVSDTTHFDVTATYVATDTGTFYTNWCGADSVRFEDTQPTEDPTYKYDSLIEIEEGQPYRMTALVQVSSIASANGLMAVGVHWYDADDSFMSTTNVLSGKLDASGQWQRVTGIITAPIGAHFAVPYVLKYSQFGTYYAWLDDIAIEHMPIAFSAYRDSTSQNIPDSMETRVQFDAEGYDYGSAYDDASTFRFTAPIPGAYLFTTRVQIFPSGGTFNGSSTAALFLSVNGTTYTMLDHQRIPAGEAYLMLQGTETVPLGFGDTVEITVFHDDGGSPAIHVQPITSSTYRSTFSGVLL